MANNVNPVQDAASDLGLHCPACPITQCKLGNLNKRLRRKFA